ncbi:MAG: YciI family protein [Paracoccaceae bacterium]
MFTVFLKFSTNKSAAPDFMAEHNEWIAAGFADGVFQCAGSLKPEGGGAILAIGESRDELEKRVNADPFVQNDVVFAEITEVDVKKTAPALDFLKA